MMNRLRRPGMKIDRGDQAILGKPRGNDKVLSNIGAACWNGKDLLHLQNQIRFAESPTLDVFDRGGKVLPGRPPVCQPSTHTSSIDNSCSR